jgi:2-polyprenyl-3-methyl-5-hydroxy-6-metoxy-1,4-benzoquinol methylase
VTPDLHYTDPRLARLYDHDCGWGPDSTFYLSLAGPAPLHILDLGCGTGILCNAYAARGHVVTGVDPAPAMLDVARRKPQAARITWINGTAQSFHSPHRFDLIVMTGHAFQHLLTDADIAATLAMMRHHLAPSGMIAFETRNPAIDWVRRWHRQTKRHNMDEQTIQQTHHVLATNADRITFETHYAFPDASITSTTTLRFAAEDTITRLARDQGLQVRSLFGDWGRTPFTPATSDEMIFILTAP